METVSVKEGTRLEQLLKFAGLVSTGGEAKIRIQSGEVRVNNKTETRRGYKVKEGDIITLDSVSLKVSIR